MKISILTLGWLVMAVVCCGCGGRDAERLREAAAAIEARPDSAYVILKSIDYNSLSDGREKASYALLRARANEYMGRSLVSDTLLHEAAAYYKAIGDTAAYIDAYIAYARHLRALDRGREAVECIENLSAGMPGDVRWRLNQELLGFANNDRDSERSLEIIERQIALAGTESERVAMEIKRIVPLMSLGRSREAVALCDSLLRLPYIQDQGEEGQLYLLINYSAALGENRQTAAEGARILEDILRRPENLPPSKRIELYLPLANMWLNAGNLPEADRYVGMIKETGIDVAAHDPVAGAYLEFLEIVLDYRKTGVLSFSRISNVARGLRKVSDDLEIKRQERDDALESAYDLSREKYELTIRHQRMWIVVMAIILVSIVAVGFLWYVSRRRRQRLIEAEERISTLEEMVKSAVNPATDEKEGLLKRLLLQQMGILKTFAESPTAQNRDALRKISNIGNSDTPIDSLVKWDDFYTTVDELYSGFHRNLVTTYGDVLSEREIQIISLIRAGFSTKEIGVLLQQSSNSIYVSKTSIRKKLGLGAKEDFMEVLTALAGTSGES